MAPISQGETPTRNSNLNQRSTVFVEEAEILSHDAFDGAQHVLRVQAPKVASRARPGTFAHIQCDRSLPMRRPMSIMRTDADAGWVEFLYKVVGSGTQALALQPVGGLISVVGPIGVAFEPRVDRPRSLLLGGGVGIPPMVFLADRLRRGRDTQKPFVIMGSEVPFPFRSRPSTIMIPGMPEGVIACMPLMEDWGIPSRLASLKAYPGCYEGYVTELADLWLSALPKAARGQAAIYACGPTVMLKATAELAERYEVPCQVALEEYMACGLGGCAGCTIPVQTPDGLAMKRVCVDGPVFDARRVCWNRI